MMKQETMLINRFREAREIAGLSIFQAAKKLGFSVEDLLEIEHGDLKITGEEVKRLASFYEVGSEWLTGETLDDLTIFEGNWQIAPRDLEKIKPNELPKLLQILIAIKERKTDK
jgi:transcriptional regulator with XRE-family HTH domain